MGTEEDTSTGSTRDRLLRHAERMAAELPWHEVTMAKLAGAAGVSRQTVYNEFGTKQGLAQAVGLTVAGRLLVEFQRAARDEDGLEPALRDGLLAAFEMADDSPLVRAVLTGRSGDGLLTVVTTDASGILDLAGTTIGAAVRARWADLDPDDVDLAVDAAIRLFVSHLLQPSLPRPAVAAQIARMATAVVGTPVASQQG